MRLPRHRLAALVAAVALALPGCGAAPAETPPQDRPPLGLMTSLPLYWPADAAMADFAAGRAVPPWPRRVIETRYVLVPLDTLSPIPALAPQEGETDPLAGLARIAVIQPRGLSPADNVALDHWVRGGGRLLLALDPALTGDYEQPLGDPRRPVDAALIPPVLARWGLAMAFDPEQPLAVSKAELAGAVLPLALSGRLSLVDPAAPCRLLADGAAARCAIGEGEVTVIADAALFEHVQLAGADGAVLLALLAAALERADRG